jgi:hypothetical protein
MENEKRLPVARFDYHRLLTPDQLRWEGSVGRGKVWVDRTSPWHTLDPHTFRPRITWGELKLFAVRRADGLVVVQEPPDEGDLIWHEPVGLWKDSDTVFWVRAILLAFFLAGVGALVYGFTRGCVCQ